MKKTSIDLGLAVLAASPLHRRGVGLSCYIIAAACDCSPQNIQQLEQSALRHLRAKLRARARLDLEFHGELMGMP